MENSSEDAKIKVIDFGLSKQFTPGELMMTAAGTPFYAAPEVVLGDGYDERCDVWSCGIILYILLCGYPPFNGDTDAEVLREVVKGKFEFESPHWDDVSTAPRKLIKRMLTLNTTKRPTAHECLENRWLHDHAEKPKKTVHIDLGNRLKAFRTASKFKKVALTVIASQLPQKDIEELRDAFTTLDVDQDGMLSPQEIQEGMAASDLKLPDDIVELLTAMDSDGSGQIDYTEFIAATLDRQQYLKKEVLWAAFTRLDLSHDSLLHKSDIQNILKENEDSAVVDEILNDIDVHGDGTFSFQDFCDLMGN
jgi:calcium-dependent protein kinase